MSALARVNRSPQLIPIDIVSPGSKGLNTVQQGELMSSDYCVTAQNAIIDITGLLAARNGFAVQSITPINNIAVTGEVLAVGTGSATVFSGSTVNPNVVPSTFSITAGAVVGTDNGLGSITGTGITSGTINYITGAVTITYAAAVGNGTNIVLAYNYTPRVLTLFEYNNAGVYTPIIAWKGGISTNLQNPNLNSIVGTASATSASRWFFQNFNNKVIGFIAGQKPAVYSSTTPQLNTVVESSGTWPLSSGVGACAFGRVWSVSQSDNQTITYSDLLNETAVGTAGAGVINMANIWSNGTDVVTAIFGFNAALVVCGLKHIVLFTDGRGSLIGMDPTQAYVFDMVTGTGCISQWTVDYVGQTDVVFMSPNGVQSLSRLINNNNNPVNALTKYVRDTLLGQYATEAPAQTTGAFNAFTGFYLLTLPNSSTSYCLDMRRLYLDDAGDLCARVTTWSIGPSALACMHISPTAPFTSVYAAPTPGVVSIYSGYQDGSKSFSFSYLSPWMSFAQRYGEAVGVRQKLLKRYEVILNAGGGTLTQTWNTDFALTPQTASTTLTSPGSNSQFGIGQFGIAQFGGGQGNVSVFYDARARGQYYQFGLNILVANPFSVQQLQLSCKLGRTGRAQQASG